MTIPARTLHLGLTLSAGGTHPAGWRYPGSKPEAVFDVKALQHLARIAEGAKLDFVSIGDRPTLPERAPSGLAQKAQLEPFTVAGTIAAVTSRIGIAVAANPERYDPYTIARLTASLDHLSQGRAAWNFTAGEDNDDAQEHDRTDELVAIVGRLWDSWGDEAFVRNTATGQFIDRSKVHSLNHRGRFFSVAGPLNVARPPQGHVVTIEGGITRRSLERGVRDADIIILRETAFSKAQASYAELKSKARSYGRDDRDFVILQGITPIVAETTEAAIAIYDRLNSFLTPDHLRGGDPDPTVIVGNPEEIADHIQEWFEGRAADGFNIFPAYSPGAAEAFADLVVPILKSRGIFRKDYLAPSFRDHFGFTRPRNSFVQEEARAS